LTRHYSPCLEAAGGEVIKHKKAIVKTDPNQKIKFETVKEYLKMCPEKHRHVLEEIRFLVKSTVPEAEEVISYNMPAFKYHGVLVYFAAHKNHIGFYPGSSIVNEIYRDELKEFETSKGTIRFSVDVVLPKELIIKIVQFKAEFNLAKKRRK
jgi:uncharacterized protein YdhG (YjbR/CyaY superfamily)